MTALIQLALAGAGRIPPCCFLDRRGGAGSINTIPNYSSERIPPSADFQHGPEENLKVQPEAPVGDVPEVQFDPPFHKVDRWRLAAKSTDLGPPGNPGLHMVAIRIA
jgi:hypothetical protein